MTNLNDACFTKPHAREHKISSGCIVKFIDEKGALRCARILSINFKTGMVMLDQRFRWGNSPSDNMPIQAFTRTHMGLTLPPRPSPLFMKEEVR